MWCRYVLSGTNLGISACCARLQRGSLLKQTAAAIRRQQSAGCGSNWRPSTIIQDAARNCNAGYIAHQPLRRLLCCPVATITGRIRGGVTFTAARNSPFQGLAADGAKLAMWQLMLAGYRVVAFVHDEFVIELPAAMDHTAAAKHIEQICCSTMQELVGDIPVACEYALTDRWYKQATAIYDSAGKLIPWRPDSR